jgi:hypothetical protein
MSYAILFFFELGLPIAACLMISCARNLLLNVIPKLDPEVNKTRTDIFVIRASYACFMVGVVILAIWAIGVTVLGIIAGIRLL